MISITREKTALVFPNAIGVQTAEEKVKNKTVQSAVSVDALSNCCNRIKENSTELWNLLHTK